MRAFRVAPPTEATLGHPLITGPLLRNEAPVFDRAAPVPTISEIPAGFDAIFQFTAPLLSDYLRRELGRTAYTVISYDTSNLSAAVKHEILRRLQVARQPGTPASSPGGPVIIIIGSGTSAGGGTTTEITELPDSLLLRITAHRPTIQLSTLIADPLFDAKVEWTIDIEIGVPEPAADTTSMDVLRPNVDLSLGLDGGGGTSTSAIGVPSSSLSPPVGPAPAGGGTSLRFVPLTQGAADTLANVRVSTFATQYQAWARLDFTGTSTNIRPSGDSLSTELLNGQVNGELTNGIQQSLARVFAHPELNITPRMALAGILQSNEQLAGLQAFRVNHTTSFGNRRSHRVLSLCVNVGPNNVSGDLTLVRPFVDDKNFAYYLSEPIVSSVLQLRWARLPPPIEFTGMIPIDYASADDPDLVVQGRGHIRFRILSLADVLFDVSTVDLPDAIRLSGSAETTLLEAWDEQNQPVSDLGDFGTPVVAPFALRIYPFGAVRVPQIPPGPAKHFIESIVTHLLDPVDRPSAEVITVREVAGQLSAPLHGLFMRSRLLFS